VAPLSEDPKLIIRAINFELTQHVRPRYINVSDRQTDLATLRYHYVHRAVKTKEIYFDGGSVAGGPFVSPFTFLTCVRDMRRSVVLLSRLRRRNQNNTKDKLWRSLMVESR